MATFGEAVDLILTEIARTDSSITVVTEREYRKAVEHYAQKRFWFNEGRISFTASNTIYYPMSAFSATMLEIDQVSTTIGGTVVMLQPKTHQELNEIDASGQTGNPVFWALFAEQIRIYPKLASGSTKQINIDGHRKLATLSASTDSNVWTTEAIDLISARVEKHLMAKKFNNPERAAVYAEVEREELQKLEQRTERLLSMGRIRAGY